MDISTHPTSHRSDRQLTTARRKACERCARSKIKCIWESNESCHGCAKSNSECIATQLHPRKPRGKSMRVKNLEQKLDAIVSLLGNPQTHTTDYAYALQPIGEPLARFTPSTSTIPDIADPIQPQFPPLAGVDGISETEIKTVSGLRIPLVKADTILDSYRSEMLLSFPFVPIPPYRANQANRESPALLSAILYTCRFELSSVTGDSDKSFREYFARQSVVNDEKSLDLLQAILLFLAWDDWQSVATARDTSLMHLSLGLVGDLGLNRPPLSQTVPVGSCSIANQSNVKIKGFNVRKEHSNAEKRALLGVFYITSVVWTLFRRTEPPEYTNYMEQCCNDLTEAREYVTDSIVVALVRMQSLIVQIAKAFPHPSLRSHVFPTVPLSLYFSTIQFQLKDILRQVPEAQRLNYLILSHEHTVLLRLYEPVIHMDSLQSIDHSISKTDVLWSCCQEAKTFFEMWLRLPAGVYSATPCALFAHIAFANLTLTQLLFADDRHWNSQIAREHVDYPVIVRRLIDHIEIYRKQSGQDFGGVEGNFSHPQCYVEKWRYAINWYYAKLNSKYPASATIPASETLLPLVGDDDELWQTMFAFENEMMY